MRRGFQLVEVLLALGLAAGPLLVVIGLVQANVGGSRTVIQRTTARHALVDLAALLRHQSVGELRALASTGALHALLMRRADHLPDTVRDAFRRQLRHLSSSLRLELAENVGGLPGLVRITLCARLERGEIVRASHLFRVASGTPD